MRSMVEGAQRWSFVSAYTEMIASRPAPLPPRGACHRAGHFGPDPLARSPSPTFVGEDKHYLFAALM